MIDNIFLSQKIRIKKKYTNKELKLYQYFHKKTKFYPEYVIILNQFIFLFVNNDIYFEAKVHLNSIRKQLEKKVVMIRAENTLIKLLFSFFPDPYIHDIKIEINEENGKKIKIITIYFLSFEERGIAIGRQGAYIKAVNEIFEKYIIYEKKDLPITLKCKLLNL
ncbi:MAG: hypothetical protein EU529_07275 [Promethearchaeota archaeon]|nr:MAG: hypothetical protein EU529_07275 [Candidatus Lokiarchaeota archaeon]